MIPSDSTGESVGSSPSLVILLDTEAEVMAIHVFLPEIAPEAAFVVAPPIVALYLIIEFDPEVEPSKALPSPDYVPSSPIHAPASPDYHPGPDTESEPFEDESEPIEDALEAAEPLPAQVAPPPPVQISPTEPTPTLHIIPYDTRATARMTARPQPTLPLGYRAAIARWSDAPLSTLYPSHSSEYSASLSGSSSAAPSVPRSGPSHRRSRYVSSLSSSSGTSHTPPGALPRRRHLISSYSTPPSSVGPSHKNRSSTTSLQAAASTPAVLSFVPADRLPPHKRLRASPDVSNKECYFERRQQQSLPFHPVTIADG
ncbi:hypothetical protein Tco_1092559 [Tanacetum coccineum]|uniref:Uncharacterized protein n=1 Tax=Tanacetum coccineum TaxID=301880 RepID=A0ABQ5IAB1_9ASTR